MIPDIERDYGQDNPNFYELIIFEGLKNDDTPEDLYQKPNVTCSADRETWYGEYPIILSGGFDPRYNFFLTDGTLTIRPSAGLEYVLPDTIENYTIHNLFGQLLYYKVDKEKLNSLNPGIYIINGKKVLIK